MRQHRSVSTGTSPTPLIIRNRQKKNDQVLAVSQVTAAQTAKDTVVKYGGGKQVADRVLNYSSVGANNLMGRRTMR